MRKWLGGGQCGVGWRVGGERGEEEVRGLGTKERGEVKETGFLKADCRGWHTGFGLLRDESTLLKVLVVTCHGGRSIIQVHLFNKRPKGTADRWKAARQS